MWMTTALIEIYNQNELRNLGGYAPVAGLNGDVVGRIRFYSGPRAYYLKKAGNSAVHRILENGFVNETFTSYNV